MKHKKDEKLEDEPHPEYGLNKFLKDNISEENAERCCTDTPPSFQESDTAQDICVWHLLFERTHTKLVAAARQAKQQIAEGLAQPLDYDQL